MYRQTNFSPVTLMKPPSRSQAGEKLPADYARLCRHYAPRPLHNAKDYRQACQAIAPLLGFEDRLNADQLDYVAAVRSFIEANDAATAKWVKRTPLVTLKYLLEQHQMTAADLARVLESDRSLGSKLLRGERHLTLAHARKLARHFKVNPGVLVGGV